MKKLLFLFLFLPLLAFTQVPQGVGYQGVATDAAGFELINQSISIRASVISGSAAGNIEWQEIHNTSTDTFGLFNLTIGQGTSTGNGAQTSFADITWGANTHFLKIEMDVNGGTNYSHMGTNQMMSVPYALYAENANINYDSIATIISNDSSFINNFNIGGNIVFGDRVPINFQFISDTTLEIFATQDGFLTGWLEFYNSDIAYFYCDTFSGNFTFRAGLSSNSYGNDKAFNFPIKKGDYYRFTRNSYINFKDFYFTPLVTDSSLYTSYNSSNSIGGGCDYKFPDGLDGDFITVSLTNNNQSTPYTVPAGKTLYITSAWAYGVLSITNDNGSDSPIIESINYSGLTKGRKSLQNPIIIGEGKTISDAFGQGGSINGFLVDNSQINPITEVSSFQVPAGKNLYITNCYGGNLYIDNIQVDDGAGGYYTLGHPILVNAGQTVNPSGSCVFNGYLADENYFADCGGGGSSSSTSTIDSSYIDSLVQFYSSGNGGGGCNPDFPDGFNNVEPISWSLHNSNPYTVPVGKNLYIVSAHGSGAYGIYVDGLHIHYGNEIQDENYLIFGEGEILTNNANSPTYYLNFNGYLVDEDYFADCGGGGSSSSGGGNNNSLILGIVSQCGDTLFTSNGFIIIPEISQSNLRNHFSTSSVSDVDGNIYKTVIYGDDEWMVENLKTNVGDYLTWSQANSTNPPSTPVTFPDSIGHYYSSSTLLNVCPSGWHVPTLSEWQNLHSEIFCGNVMNPNGYTNPSNGYQENNYEILWSSDEQGGTNLSLFNLFSSGNYQNGIIGWGNDYSTHFWSTSNCGSNFYRINIPVSNSGTDFELDVGCTCTSCGVYTQIRCVKD